MCQGAFSIIMNTNKNKNSALPQRRVFLREPIQEENSVFRDIRTVLFILKATGLLPIFEHKSLYQVEPPSKSNEFYSFFVRGAVHAFTIFYLYNLFTSGESQLFDTSQGSDNRDTDNINQWIEILLCILTYTATVIMCSRHSKAFLTIINDMLKVDEEMQQHFGNAASLKNNCGFSVKFLVFICFCQCYIVLLRIKGVSGNLTPTSYVLIIFYALQNGLSTTFIVFAAAILRIIAMRFSFVNKVLDGYTYVHQSKIVPARNIDISIMETFPDDALFCFRMHNKLLRIYKATNDCCSLILVGYMGYAFYTITTNTYNLFVQITQKEISIQVLQWCSVWLLMHTALLVLLSRSCGLATNEVSCYSVFALNGKI